MFTGSVCCEVTVLEDVVIDVVSTAFSSVLAHDASTNNRKEEAARRFFNGGLGYRWTSERNSSRQVCASTVDKYAAGGPRHRLPLPLIVDRCHEAWWARGRVEDKGRVPRLQTATGIFRL